jgi:hypothetical protein
LLLLRLRAAGLDHELVGAGGSCACAGARGCLWIVLCASSGAGCSTGTLIAAEQIRHLQHNQL